MNQQIKDSVVSTKYWSALRDGRVQCDLCPRKCKLHSGQRGACFVRAEQDGQIVLTSYGRSTGFCIDPIEKKPLNHFLPGSSVLSFGTAGCNLACKFCQNWDSTKSRETDIMADSAMPETLATAAKDNGCASIAFTYNDPIIFMEYALDVADAASEQGVRSVAVTAGYICKEPCEDFFKPMDAVNVDLKAFTERFYKKICAAELAPTLDTLRYIHGETNAWLEITTLLIPGENDSNREIEELSSWVSDELSPNVPLHFSAFHPDWKMTDKQRTPATTLIRARNIALANGLNYVYTGNVHDPAGGSTYCPGCHKMVIERDWYQLGSWRLDADGCCSNCARMIDGVFNSGPGTWGPRRELVKIIEQTE
jgi:pyruvate formate lyase activating enzyme